MWPFSPDSKSYFTKSGASGPNPSSTEPQSFSAYKKQGVGEIFGWPKRLRDDLKLIAIMPG